ncbi:MAG: YicC family protein [Deltaproteobacteria bacterium RIFOXYD12_FULL_55_16]|nr:MAG: YicC family protein [Deltaproteobacteria bacterium RIFOXYD12_FULL_55_16]
MIRPLSMTGYGRGEFRAGTRSWTVEIRSVNHKFLDLSLKIPRKYLGLEERLKKEISAYYSRGHVDVYVNPGAESGDGIRLAANLPLARNYYQCLEDIRQELSLPDAPTLAMIQDYKEIIIAHEEEEDLEAVWPQVLEALTQALNMAQGMRAQEGAALKAELHQRLQVFARTVEGIAQDIPGIVLRRTEKLKERLVVLLQGIDLDPLRLAQEVAMMADKADVTEEVVRLRSHINQFNGFLAADEPVGRRLDFLLQEFLREINTLASKISDAPIAHLTVELKTEVEKLREQIQNIE